MPALPESLRSLRQRNYRLFCSGQIISLIGTWMQMVTMSWLVYRLTGKAAMLGLMAFCNLIPVFILAPVGGLLAGLLAHRLGAPVTVALGGLGCAACGCAFTLHYRSWRDGARVLLRTAGDEPAGFR